MSTLFLPETPKGLKKDDIELKNVISKGMVKKKLLSIEEADLLLKIQNSENDILEEGSDYLKQEEDQSSDDCLKRTPIRKRCDREQVLTKSNKLLTTPKKYFGEDILNSVPKNVGRFRNSVDRSSLYRHNNTILTGTPHERKIKRHIIETKKSLCNRTSNNNKLEFSCISRNVSTKLDLKNLKELCTDFFCMIYDFLIYQLPFALIAYSFSLYLISCL